LTDNPTNARVFERADGLLAASALLREAETTRAVKQTVLEFLYFYLLPEEHSEDWHNPPDTMRRIGRSGSGSSNGSSNSSKGSEWGDISVSELNERSVLRTVKEKQKMLSKYLSNVGSLKQDFKTMKVFEGVVG
jgi:Cell division control protein 14, SIN component